MFVAMLLSGLSMFAADKGSVTNTVEMRVFKVDSAALVAALGRVDNNFAVTNAAGGGDTHVIKDWKSLQKFNNAAMALFKSVGVDLTRPGRTMAYNEKESLLFVKAMPSELESIDYTLSALARVPPQIHLHTKFMKVPEDEIKSLLKAGKPIGEQGKSTVEILPLTPAELTKLQRRLADAHAETLSEPDVITANNRPAQVSGGTTALELNPTLFDDIYTLRLRTAIARPEVLVAQGVLWDGQTLMVISSDSQNKKRIVVFITPTVVDSAGKRFHEDSEIKAFQKQLKKDIPVQD